MLPQVRPKTTKYKIAKKAHIIYHLKDINRNGTTWIALAPEAILENNDASSIKRTELQPNPGLKRWYAEWQRRYHHG